MNINIELILSNEIPKFKDFLKHAIYRIMPEINFEDYGVDNDVFRINNLHWKDYDIEILIWESKIATISYFGDIALRESCPRTATVYASRPTDLIVLHKSQYDKIRLKVDEVKVQTNIQIMNKFPLFKNLSKKLKQKICWNV